MITENDNIQSVAEKAPGAIPIFEKHGMGKYFKPEALKKIGRYIKLETILKSSGINVAQFIEVLNTAAENSGETVNTVHQELHFMAMLPCGLQNPFKELIETHINSHKEQYEGLNYLVEGNLNHVLSYYPLVDSFVSIDELPDIIIASDVNNFLHRPFIEKFIEKGLFEAYLPFTPHNYLDDIGYPDPSNNYTMLTANMLIMAVDKTRLGNRKMPQTWGDILLPEFENDVIIRGEADFFCNAVMLPLYKDFGFDGIRAFAPNVKDGRHPAEMVKLADANKPESATIYVMPYFFSKNIKNQNIEIVFPEDGAITSPVFMLVKKSATEKHKPLLDYIVSKEVGELFVKRLFPSINPNVDNSPLPFTGKWIGWDFIRDNDLAVLKAEIQAVFKAERAKKIEL
ncbi:MAG: ABC transporter substrate-binding protein [Bacteroidales bacterium]|nr:ABC transporter substrate-binding protein [Bacteroidales bacterium]